LAEINENSVKSAPNLGDLEGNSIMSETTLTLVLRKLRMVSLT
jgi:hypothetical protein